MISTVQLLFLKTSSGPPCSLGTEKFGCTLCWIIFENPQSIILKNFFQWKSWLLQILSHPLAEQHGASAVSRPPYFLETHLLVEVTGDIKIFLECPEKCRPNPIFFLIPKLVLVGIYLAKVAKLQYFFLPRKKSGGKKEIVSLHRSGLEVQIRSFTSVNKSKM